MLLAQAGIGSRRYCEILISRGRVSVNGELVTELGSRASWNDEIRVDGNLVLSRPASVVYMLNKPRGVVSAMSDPYKPSVGDLVAGLEVRLFHVGRLDEDTTGLLLLTDDGALIHKLTSPKHHVPKVYEARCKHPLTPAMAEQLLTGVEIGRAHV